MPGSSLSTRGLAQELGVSQMPVREALSRLAAEGAVEIRSKRRIVVPPMTAERFADLLRCRELLEPEAAAMALPHIDAARLKRLRAVDDALGVALQDRRRAALHGGNFDFHFTIYRAQPRAHDDPADRDAVAAVRPVHAGRLRPLRHGEPGRPAPGRAARHPRAADADALGRAILADIRDGMGLIGKSGFAARSCADVQRAFDCATSMR